MTHPPPGKYLSIAANQRVKREDEKAASPDPLPSDEAVEAAWREAHEASRDYIAQPTVRAALTAAYRIDMPRREAEVRAEADELRAERDAAILERDVMRKANVTPPDADRPLGQSVEYWQDRALDYATALDKARVAGKQLDGVIVRLSDENQRLREDLAEVRPATLREVEALREALRFYSDGFAYLTPEGWRRIWRDGGQVAREALAHFNPEAEPKRPRNHAPWCSVEHKGPCDFNQETE